MVIKNYLYNLAYQILAICLPIITIPYVSRILGADGLGVYALTSTYAQYFVMIGMLGLNMYSSREIAYVREDHENLSNTFWELNFLRFITMGIALIIYILIFGFIIKSDNKIVYIIQVLVVLSALFDISWLFTGLENFKKVAIRNMLVKFIGAVLVFTLVKYSSQVWLYSLIIGGTQFIGQVVMWVEIPKEIRFIIPKKSNIIKHLKFSIRLFIPQIAVTVYTMLDKVMLGIFTDTEQVGMYDNSQKIIKIMVTVVTTLATVTIPKMANLYKNNHYEEFEKNIYKSFSFVTFVTFPMTFGLIGISESFVKWFYGIGFEGMIPMFYVGAFLMITLGWSSIVGSQVLISIQREKQFTICVTTGAILNIIFNFILINKYQGVGTTISSVIAEYSGMFLMIYFARDTLSVKKLFKSVPKYLTASLIMFIIIKMMGLFMQYSVVSMMVQIMVGGTIYLFIMFLIKDENFTLIYKIILNLFRKKINIA